MKEKLIVLLIKHEGLRLHVYPDSKGLATIGIGRCLETKGLTIAECSYLNLGVSDKQSVIEKLTERGITKDEAFYLLNNDIDDVTNELIRKTGYFTELPEIVQMCLIDMAVNLGVAGLLDFKKTLNYISEGDYVSASVEMLNSKWKNDVGDRAMELSRMIASA